MVDIKDVVFDLRQRGARFSIRDGRVHVGAPSGLLTEETRGLLSGRRGELWSLMIDVARASDEERVGTHIFEELAREAFGMQERGEWDSPEYAEERARVEEQMDRNQELLARCGPRYSEYERIFGEGCVYRAHLWLVGLCPEPREGEIDDKGTIGEVIRI
jgi:hypothetical protein